MSEFNDKAGLGLGRGHGLGHTHGWLADANAFVEEDEEKSNLVPLLAAFPGPAPAPEPEPGL